jgi:hypothetical protein
MSKFFSIGYNENEFHFHYNHKISLVKGIYFRQTPGKAVILPEIN